jgi:hypothetical protein
MNLAGAIRRRRLVRKKPFSPRVIFPVRALAIAVLRNNRVAELRPRLSSRRAAGGAASLTWARGKARNNDTIRDVHRGCERWRGSELRRKEDTIEYGVPKRDRAVSSIGVLSMPLDWRKFLPDGK